MDDLYKDPSQMTDEELDAALEGKVVEEPKDPPEDPKDPPAPSNDPPSDPPADPPADPKEDPKDPPEDPPADPPQDPPAPKEDPKDPPTPSPREAKRIQALIEKMKQGSQPPAPQQQPVQPPTPPEIKPINYRELIDAPEEVYAQLEKASEEYGKSLLQGQAPQTQQPPVNQPTNVDEMNSIRWEMGVKFDTPQVLAKYPRLDPKSPDFDPISADALNMEYLHTVGLDQQTGLVRNPNISYAEFVEARYELANLLADEKVQTSTKNITKQAATTGLRPDGSQSKRLNLNQAPENMSDEELDAAIAQGIPS